MPAVITRLLGPLKRLVARTRAPADSWGRLDHAPPLAQFGPGARHEFSHYLQGTSSVTISSVAEMQEWLLGCEYQTDEALFHEEDFWQHPDTFERMRAGDCEDFALWAWRTLIALNVDVDFVVGLCTSEGRPQFRHAWIVFRDDGLEYVLEPAATHRDRMIQPLAAVRHQYLPQIGVDRHARRFTYRGSTGGLLHTL
ncbi:MAG: transglutaminase family protein cysteine peptidase [Gemmatimonadetes bacterium]|nr:transglutaminase family protein cysteine peptidase [Gemmatimonadota bacterium]